MGGTIIVENPCSSCYTFHLNRAEQKSLDTQKHFFELNDKAEQNPSVPIFVAEIASRVDCLFISC